MIWAKDINGRLLLANKSLANAYGLTPNELEGEMFNKFHKNLSPEEFNHFMKDDIEVISTWKNKIIEEEMLEQSKKRKMLEEELKKYKEKDD